MTLDIFTEDQIFEIHIFIENIHFQDNNNKNNVKHDLKKIF